MLQYIIFLGAAAWLIGMFFYIRDTVIHGKTKNLGNIDIILGKAGKGEAIKYLLNQQSQTPRTFGIGDDVNDQELLEAVDEPFVLGSAYPEILQLAEERGMYVSMGLHFDGINEILLEINRRIRSRG